VIDVGERIGRMFQNIRKLRRDTVWGVISIPEDSEDGSMVAIVGIGVLTLLENEAANPQGRKEPLEVGSAVSIVMAVAERVVEELGGVPEGRTEVVSFAAMAMVMRDVIPTKAYDILTGPLFEMVGEEVLFSES
jgi:hypothetical protein